MSDQRYTLTAKKIASLVSIKQKIATLYKAYLFPFQKHKRPLLLLTYFLKKNQLNISTRKCTKTLYQDLDCNIFSLKLSPFPNKLFYLKASETGQMCNKVFAKLNCIQTNRITQHCVVDMTSMGSLKVAPLCQQNKTAVRNGGYAVKLPKSTCHLLLRAQIGYFTSVPSVSTCWK